VATKVKGFEGESHEQLVNRVKKELVVTLVTATLSMTIGYFIARLI